MSLDRRLARDGVIAGLIGAVIVAVWFLIYDAAHGRPFRTPALLGAAAFRGVADPATVSSTPGLVAQYTVLHGVVFALIGLLVAWLIVSAQRAPAGMLVLFIVLVSFEVFFLALLVLLAHPVLDEIAWWTILVANALAALGMVAYLLLRHRALARVLLGPWTAIAREGLVAGLLGATVVAVWFLFHDLAIGEPLRTPAILGAVLLEGARDPSAVQVSVGLVARYTVLHGALFVAFGWLAAGLLAAADREPRLLFVFVLLFCCFEVFFGVLLAVLAEWVLEAIAWWTVLVANLLASAAMLGYFFRGHRMAVHAFLSAR